MMVFIKIKKMTKAQLDLEIKKEAEANLALFQRMENQKNRVITPLIEPVIVPITTQKPVVEKIVKKKTII